MGNYNRKSSILRKIPLSTASDKIKNEGRKNTIIFMGIRVTQNTIYIFNCFHKIAKTDNQGDVVSFEFEKSKEW